MQIDLKILKDKSNIEVHLNTNDPIDVDLEVYVYDAVSDANIIEGIMGQENKSEEDDSNNEQKTEILKKSDIKDAMDAISIIEDYSFLSKFVPDMRNQIGDQHSIVYLKILYKVYT